MKDYYITRTISLSQSNGVVHIEAEVDDWEDGHRTIYIEWDAHSLLDDIPALYEFAIKAEDGWKKHRETKYKQLKKKL